MHQEVEVEVLKPKVMISVLRPGQYREVYRVARGADSWPRNARDLLPSDICLVGLVAQWQLSAGHRMVGYSFHEFLGVSRVQVRTIVVHPLCRCRGVGRALFRAILYAAALMERSSLVCTVDERSLSAQLFLRACGMEAFRIDRSRYVVNGENRDGYRFSAPVNRLTTRHGIDLANPPVVQ